MRIWSLLGKRDRNKIKKIIISQKNEIERTWQRDLGFSKWIVPA
jgi:hypothetical protein